MNYKELVLGIHSHYICCSTIGGYTCKDCYIIKNGMMYPYDKPISNWYQNEGAAWEEVWNQIQRDMLVKLAL